MSTLDLIRLLRRALNRVRDANDRRAVTEVARGLVGELNERLAAVAAPAPAVRAPDELRLVDACDACSEV